MDAIDIRKYTLLAKGEVGADLNTEFTSVIQSILDEADSGYFNADVVVQYKFSAEIKKKLKELGYSVTCIHEHPHCHSAELVYDDEEDYLLDVSW